MPLSEAEQLFVERFVLTGDMVAAVIESGLDTEVPLPPHIIAQKQLRRAEINDAIVISRRIRDKMEQVSIGAGLTRDAQIAKLESLYREARERGKHADAIKAVETQSKLLGQMVDKHEVIIGQKVPTEMSVTEMRKEFQLMMESERRAKGLPVIDVEDMIPTGLPSPRKIIDQISVDDE